MNDDDNVIRPRFGPAPRAVPQPTTAERLVGLAADICTLAGARTIDRDDLRLLAERAVLIAQELRGGVTIPNRTHDGPNEDQP